MKTRDEIEDLKRQWREDQGWELAETEDFEEHAAPLLSRTPHATVKRVERQRGDTEAMQIRHDDELDALRAEVRRSK